mmetsp:Transcript_22296/g.46806  ORF Transcript_22296/g.46806 Transcript_22296/m.46806 type:complete len:297 (-) Transcript_22296:15-905(-)
MVLLLSAVSEFPLTSMPSRLLSEILLLSSSTPRSAFCRSHTALEDSVLLLIPPRPVLFCRLSSGGADSLRHTHTQLMLSVVCRLIASSTISSLHRLGSLCSLSRSLAKVTAPWDEKTSQRPSLPISTNSSSDSTKWMWMSGSAMRGPGEPSALRLSSSTCQSPIALETASCPFKKPSPSMKPPASCILSHSLKSVGFWSCDRPTACPRRLSTARESPTFATTIFSPRTSIASAVVPDSSSGSDVHASPNSASVLRHASRKTSIGVSGKCSWDTMLSRRRLRANVAAQMPEWPSKTP